MTWQRPEAWALLTLAVPIALLHLRWRKRREARVSSLAVWRDLGIPGSGRRGFRRVLDGIQLAALLLALAAFTAALAGPVTGSAAPPSQRTAIVLDVSASMNALDPLDGSPDLAEGPRIRTARTLLADVLARLGPDDDVVVWAASARPYVAVEPTRDVAAARAAIAAIPPTLEPCGVAETLRRAREALGAGGRIVVVTDAVGVADLAAASVRADEAVVLDVGGAGDAANSGIASLHLDAADARLTVRTVRTDGAPVARTAVLRSGDREIARADLAPADDAEATFDVRGVAGPVTVRLEPGDCFAADDVADLVLPSLRPLRVAVVAGGAAPSPFLIDALRAMPDVVDADHAVLAGPEAPADAYADADVLIVVGAAPTHAPADRPALVFEAPGRAVARPVLGGVGDHPVLDGLDLTPLRIESANVLAPGPGDRSLVECSAGPVVVASTLGGVRRLRIGFRPDATTLPLEPVFPALVRNALRWLARGPLLPPFVRAGAPVVASENLPGVESVWVDGPGGLGAREVRVRDGALEEPAPLPAPEGSRLLRVRGLGSVAAPGAAESRDATDAADAADAATGILWTPPPGFRIAPAASPAPAFPADADLSRLADRSDLRDTRERLAPLCAAAGAVLLAVAALLLRASPGGAVARG